MGRSKAEQATRGKWWNAGHALGGRDSTKPENQGLDDRARKGIEAENARPWGQNLAGVVIRDRHKHRTRH